MVISFIRVGDGLRDSGKHELEDAKDEDGYTSISTKRLVGHITEGKVVYEE